MEKKPEKVYREGSGLGLNNSVMKKLSNFRLTSPCLPIKKEQLFNELPVK